MDSFENNMYHKYRNCFVGTVHNDYGTFEIPTVPPGVNRGDS